MSPLCFRFVANTKCSKTTDSNARSVTSSSTYGSHISGKRGKRQKTTHSVLGSGEGKYYCTYCWKNFASISVWKRHERTIHNPETTYECRMAEMIGNLESTCGGCLISSNDPSQVACLKSRSHYYDRCANWSKEARTFTRIDHFRAHLLNIHDAIITPAMDSWIHMSSINGPFECGYCGQWFPSWSERLVHIGEHYRAEDGLDGSKWHNSKWRTYFDVKRTRLAIYNDWSLEEWRAEGLMTERREEWHSASSMKSVYMGLSDSEQSNSRTSHASDCCARNSSGMCKFDMLRHM